MSDHQHTHPHAHAAEDHSHVGEGYVALDIGDGFGAAIVIMPESMLGVEVETRMVGDTGPATHVMVLPRPINDVLTPTLVFPSLPEGDYEFWVKPDGPIALTLTVPDSGIGEATWPSPDR